MLVSRKWSGKTLADHRADRQQWLLDTLGVSATDVNRYTWELVVPGDPDHLDYRRRLLHVVADRVRWQAALVEARRRAATRNDPDLRQPGRRHDCSVSGPQTGDGSPPERDVRLSGEVVRPKWYTVEQVAAMLGYGLTKTKYLVHSGQIRSVKDGGSRRILPEWVDDYIRQRVEEQ